MNYLRWENRLETGIPVIDGQHKRIVKYINQLHDVYESENIKEGEVEEVILKLVDYTLSHFAFEESLLHDSNYPEYHDHINEHIEFSDKVFGYKSGIEGKEYREIAKSVMEMLKKWLYGHILQEDAKYVDHVKSFIESGQVKDQKGWITRKLKRYF